VRVLFDVNLLIAMFQPDHTHYRDAHEWWRVNQAAGWASCPLTQNGFVRILSQPKFPKPMSIDGAIALLQRVTSTDEHSFWPDDISLTAPQLFDHSSILGPKQLTDIYLLALAMKNGGRLATFDRAIPLAAVRGAEPRHVVII
jgi:uncharacterized protein